MKNLKSKKFVISLVGIILVFVLFVGVQVKASANERLVEYQKYCQEDCGLAKVSTEQLDQTIKERKATAVASIEKSSKSINETTEYLSGKTLNDEETKSLESLKPETKYSKDEEYSVDQLIEMETNYSEVSKKLSNLKTSYRTRYLTSQIKSNQKAINKTKTSLKDYDLTNEESKTEKSLNKKLTFDSEKEYTVGELSKLNKTYKSVKSEYSTLLSEVKDRVASEKAQAEANAIAQQEVVNNSATEDYAMNYTSNNTTDYSTDTSASTTNANTNNSSSSSKSTSSNASSSNNNTSSSNTDDTCYDEQGRYNSACATYENNGDTSNQRTCPYQSEDSAWAAAEKQLETNGYVGFGVYPCAEGTWEIDYF